MGLGDIETFAELQQGAQYVDPATGSVREVDVLAWCDHWDEHAQVTSTYFAIECKYVDPDTTPWMALLETPSENRFIGALTEVAYTAQEPK